MLDAAFLAMSDGSGGPWWRPARLDDLYATPDRVLTLFRYYRMGQIARERPYDWWRATGTGRPEFDHQYPVTFAGLPDAPARCGQQPPAGDAERTDGQVPCPRCYAVDNPHAPPPAGVMRFVAT